MGFIRPPHTIALVAAWILALQCLSSARAYLPFIPSRFHPERSRSKTIALADSSIDNLYYSDYQKDDSSSPPHLIFPGGGIFFYWQAGVVTYLREQGYNLTSSTATGASAGALTATLTLTNVDFEDATSLALDMAAQAGVWDRSGGLQGIWGPMIQDWLDQLLPRNEAIDQLDGRLCLLVTPVPQFGKQRIQTFDSRQDLIHCNMASVHLPWFLNGQLAANFRNELYVDGSFLARAADYQYKGPLLGSPNDQKRPRRRSSLILDYNRDPKYQSTKLLDFVQAISPDGIWQMLEDGKAYARQLEEQGVFEALPKNQETESQLIL